jgi:hypothetical protein
MSRALALQEPRAGRPALYGTRAQIADASGEVVGYLALAACDRRAGTATYALRIDNASGHPLRARMSCLQMRGNSVPAYPLDVHVAPFSRCETLLPIRLDEVGRYDRAVVEVSGGSIAFSLEAPAPARQPRRVPWFAASAASMFLVLGASFGAAAATPRIGMLDAPARAFAGLPVDVPYAYGGWGSMEYALRTSDGRRLSAGLLGDHQGTLRLNVPSSAGKDVVLSIMLAGPLGEVSRSKHIAIAPGAPRRTLVSKAQPQPPRIAEFAMTTPTARAGADIAFNYTTNASEGEIWLIDESGRLWSKTSIDTSGTTQMKLPFGTAGRQVRAVLRAKNGALDAVASVAFTVLPGDVVQTVTAAAPPSSGATLTLSNASVAPGENVAVTIAGGHGDTTVALNDQSGTSLETGDVSEGQTSVTMTAPSAPGTYFVTANVSSGVSSQTLVQKLIVSK